MKPVLAHLTEVVGAAFASCGYDAALGTVHISDRLDLCQYQCNGAFAGAKQYHKAPLVIAGEVAAVLAKNPLFAKAEGVRPGFINLTLSDEAMLKAAFELATDEHLGIPQTEKPETIVLDYGGPNIAKPLHIGHLRPAIIGEALKRLMRASGCKVIGDVHMGDWGLPIGLVIAELEVRMPGYSCYNGTYQPGDPLPPVTTDLLNEVYPFASAKSKEDKAFSERAHAITVALQQHEPGFIALWQEIRRISVEDMSRSYKKLNVTFDLWYGESNSAEYIDATVNAMREKDILYKDNGAMIVDVAEDTDKSPVPPAIIIKTDGGVTYQATDIATILQRVQDLNATKIWYVVDFRQGLHFQQVFRAARKAGIAPENVELAHLPNGTMNGSDGKPYKTRGGGVMRLSDLLDTATQAALEKISGSSYVEEGNHEELARKVGMAAIKFGDLINHRTKDYIFDLDKFLSFEGKTGTYVLYTVTRINSILKKAGVAYDAPVDFRGIYSDDERDILLKILGTPEVFATAVAERAPNYLCENAYQLAVAFSGFYHNHRILAETDEDKKATWLSLCLLVRRLILLQMDILGIDTVENM